jgi:hypothetical protein
VCVRESAGVWCTCECVERDGGRGGRRGEVGVGSVLNSLLNSLH